MIPNTDVQDYRDFIPKLDLREVGHLNKVNNNNIKLQKFSRRHIITNKIYDIHSVSEDLTELSTHTFNEFDYKTILMYSIIIGTLIFGFVTTYMYGLPLYNKIFRKQEASENSEEVVEPTAPTQLETLHTASFRRAASCNSIRYPPLM